MFAYDEHTVQCGKCSEQFDDPEKIETHGMEQYPHKSAHKRSPGKEPALYGIPHINDLTDDRIVKAFKKAPNDGYYKRTGDGGEYSRLVKVRRHHDA